MLLCLKCRKNALMLLYNPKMKPIFCGVIEFVKKWLCKGQRYDPVCITGGICKSGCVNNI